MTLVTPGVISKLLTVSIFKMKGPVHILVLTTQQEGRQFRVSCDIVDGNVNIFFATQMPHEKTSQHNAVAGPRDAACCCKNWLRKR